jgi:splicing factor U2AF subunit
LLETPEAKTVENGISLEDNKTHAGSSVRNSRSRSREKKHKSRHHGVKSKKNHRDHEIERPSSRERENYQNSKDRRERHKDRRSRRSRSRSRRRGHSRRRSRSSHRPRRPKPGARRFPSKYWDVRPANTENISAMEYKNMIVQGQINPKSMISLIPGIGVPFNNEIAEMAKMLPPHSHFPLFPPGAGGLMGLAMPQGASRAVALSGVLPAVPGLISPSLFPGVLAGALPGLARPGIPGISDITLTHMSKQAKKLYVGNIPFGCEERSMLEFFQQQMDLKGLSNVAGASVLGVQINYDKNFAFVEFASIEETTRATGLDGITWQGQVLKIRRPKDYVAIPGTDAALHSMAGVSSLAGNSDNKIIIRELPGHFTEGEVRELLSLYGELVYFNLVKDPDTNLSKGYAYCEYADPRITDIAIEGLNGMPIGDNSIVVQRASLGKIPGDLGGVACTVDQDTQPTQVLVLINMVEMEELVDDEEYDDLKEDIREECAKYGNILGIEIPRLSTDGSEVKGLGKVFIKYSTIEEAQIAQSKTAGRKFADRTVLTSYLDVSKFDSKQFE